MQAKAKLVAVKGNMCLQAAALAAAQQEVETHEVSRLQSLSSRAREV